MLDSALPRSPFPALGPPGLSSTHLGLSLPSPGGRCSPPGALRSRTPGTCERTRQEGVGDGIGGTEGGEKEGPAGPPWVPPPKPRFFPPPRPPPPRPAPPRRPALGTGAAGERAGGWGSSRGAQAPAPRGSRPGPAPVRPAAPLRAQERPPAASACAATAGPGSPRPDDGLRRPGPPPPSPAPPAPAVRAVGTRALRQQLRDREQVPGRDGGLEGVSRGKSRTRRGAMPLWGALSVPKPGFLSQNSNAGHSSETNPYQRRMRCRRIFRRTFPNSTEHISATTHTSFSQQQGGETAMSDPPIYTRRRYTPYGIPPRHQRINLHKRNQMYINREGWLIPPERKMEDKQDDTSKNWFKVIILSGIKYDKKWLLDLIQSQCNIPFTPVEFHYEKMHAQFFVDNPDIAFELKNISDKIWDESNNKITIFISPCDEPHLVTELKSEKMDRMKLAMNQQGATSQQFLNMPRLPFVQGVIDSNLLAHPTDLSLNLRRCMAPSLDFYEEDMTQMLPLNQSNSKPYQMFGFPDTKAAAPTIDSLDESGNEMKSSGTVVKGQDLDPEEIREDQSSLSTTIPDKSSNINSILELFPKLLSLEGQESPKPSLCGLEDHKSLPTCKGSFFGSEAVKTLVLQFLQQYFFIYDNGDRQELVNAYHAEACFSLTVLFSSMDSSSSNLCGYFKHSRDMKVLKDPYMQQLLLKHKKYEIICFLHTLPKTQHDLPSFVVDICFQTETMLCFSVSGLFKEAEGSSQGCVHAFTRTFIATYGNSSDLCIINDKLLVRDVQGLPSASIPVATSSSGCLPALFQDQQKMEQTFSTQAGMNVESSQTCLDDEQWNPAKLVKAFPGSR
ncbi:nuclear RNA export factor 3 [Alexandromys fortis]|uniref:nuclear RNA export factor 3 n=1 Tax=Alexandromys fortis TaxID=100897 RepID=UPI00215261E5|nr:nuclear RNA export factor 3 [Microtus fortis]